MGTIGLNQLVGVSTGPIWDKRCHLTLSFNQMEPNRSHEILALERTNVALASLGDA